MPTISWFYGIAIRMFFNDHAPPHFHAFHSGHEARFDIGTGEMIDGYLRGDSSDSSRDGFRAIIRNFRRHGRRSAPILCRSAFPAWTPTMTTDIVHVRKLKRLGDYRLKLWFTDGRAGEWDFSGLAAKETPVTRPFKDPAYFDRVFIEMGALTWPNGYDWSPEALHADMEAAGALKFESAAA
ncbi:MAG: DUF4160 domain-containing protein [Caulobacteraceae bacterium]